MQVKNISLTFNAPVVKFTIMLDGFFIKLEIRKFHLLPRLL